MYYTKIVSPKTDCWRYNLTNYGQAWLDCLHLMTSCTRLTQEGMPSINDIKGNALNVTCTAIHMYVHTYIMLQIGGPLFHMFT